MDIAAFSEHLRPTQISLTGLAISLHPLIVDTKVQIVFQPNHETKVL